LYAAILDSLDKFDIDEVANEDRKGLYGGIVYSTHWWGSTKNLYR
jgi:hypothetical protein